MADEISPQQPVSQKNIMDQTLGDLLGNNPQAQQMITQSMGVSQQQFQQMLGQAQQNNMMHMKIGDLFKSGVVQQAQMIQGQPVQVSPQQMQQIMQMVNGSINATQQIQNAPADKVAYTLPTNAPQKSWWKKLLGL